MKCNQSRPGFELESPCSFPTTITTTPRVVKVYSTFLKAPRLEPLHQIVLCHIQDTHWGGVFPLCWDAVSISYSSIQWELCKWFEFSRVKKLYTHKPESVRENETPKILWDIEIQTRHPIPARRLDHIIIKNKKSCQLEDSVFIESLRMKISKWNDGQISVFFPGTQKAVEHEGECHGSF